MIQANNPERKTWLEVPDASDFPIQNIPFGIFRHPEKGPCAASRIGDTLIDLNGLANKGLLDDCNLPNGIFANAYLNDFIGLGRPVWRQVRDAVSNLFRDDNAVMRDNKVLQSEVLFDASLVELLMPVSVGDYTDFYSSIEHATNVGIMFRDPVNALLPNWRHIPVGYHGRSSSIVVSGTNILRPNGQTKPDDSPLPVFGPSKQIDFELEMAFITGKPNKLGTPIALGEAETHIFGLLLFNDLSARDIQKWEYVPLGPFLSKNFGSVVSPWIVTLDALEPFRVKGPEQVPQVLPYLHLEGAHNFDIKLQVHIKPKSSESKLVCTSNFKYMYWSMAQQLAHQTINGCNVNVGDLYGSGTISGPTPDSFGSMLELAWKGTKPITMPDGSQRSFIHDHDTIVMKAWAENQDVRIGFGEAVTTILPAIQL